MGFRISFTQLFSVIKNPASKRLAVIAYTLGVIVLFFYFILGPFLLSWAEAAVNEQINYQGKLTDTGGIAVTNGTYNMEFKLYTVSSGGSPIWTETRTSGDKVQVTSGLFSVLLGEVTSLAGVDFNQTLYLGVNIGGTGSPSWDGEMTPRKKIGAVPAALVAKTLGGLYGHQFFRTDVITSTSSAVTLLKVEQAGAGAVAEFIGNSSSTVFGIYTANGGRVGVGTSTPLATFEIGGKSGSNPFLVSSSTGAALLTVLQNGNVGVGTNNPQATLSVSNSAGNLFIATSSGVLRTLLTNLGSQTWYLNDGSSEVGRIAYSTPGSNPGIVFFNTSTTGRSQIKQFASTGGLSFGATTAGSDPGDQMVLTTNGRLGIGTTTASHTLTVTGDMNLTGALRASGVAGTAGYILQTTGSVVQWVATSSLGIVSGGSGNSAFTIGNGLIYNATSTDLVGIGTSTPSQALTVAGSLFLTGAFRDTLNASGTQGMVLLSTGTGTNWTSTSSLGFLGASVTNSLTNGFATRWNGSSFLNSIIRDNGTVAGVNATTSSYTFNVQANGATNPFAVASSSGSNMLVVNKDGSVGIGTSTPQSILSIASGVSDIRASTGISGVTPTFAVINADPSGKAGALAAGTSGAVFAFDNAGYFAIQSDNKSSFTANAIGAGTQVFQIGTTGYGQFLGGLTANSSDLANTTSLNPAFEVYKSTNKYGMDLGYSATTSKFSTRLYAPDSGEIAFAFHVAPITPTDQNSFRTRMVVKGDTGFVGIGSSTPSHTLTVTGDMNLTGALRASGVAGTLGQVLQTTGTGVQWVATSSLGISGGSGNSAFTIGSGLIYNATSTDLVGIGTTSPSTTLFVQGKGGTDPFAVASSTGSNMLVLSQAGNLNLGTTTSAGKLTVQGTGSNIVVFRASDGTNRFSIADAGTITLGQTFSVGTGAITGTSITSVSFSNGGTGTGLSTTIRGGSGTDSILNFQSSNHASASTDEIRFLTGAPTSRRMTILSSGYVGIGSSTPVARLVVQGTTSLPTLDLFQVASSTGSVMFGVTSGGRVGIATSSPSHTLTIAGDINLTGALNASGVAGTLGQVLQTTGTGVQWVATSSLGISGGSGVTSVDASVPTGFQISGGPITTSGTLAITYAAGYEGFKTASSTEYNAAYASTTALTPTYLRGLFSNTATGLTYTAATGATSLTAGYIIPLSASTTEWANFYATPSTRITAGDNLSWSGNTLNANVSTSSINYLRLVSGGLETATTTDFLRAAYFTATSTTATSTFAGRVGIGTTTPYSTLLLQGSGGLNPFVIASSTGSNMLVLSQEGRLGIGVASPTVALDVSGAVRITDTQLTNTAIAILTNNQNSAETSSGAGLQLNIDDGAQTVANDRLGFLAFGGARNGSNSILQIARIEGHASAPVSSGNAPGYLSFYTTATTTATPVEVVRMTQEGYLLIGSTTSSAKLSVVGSSGAPTVDLINIASSTNASLFVVKSSGNVGVGTSSPSHLFTVAGDMNLTGALRASGVAGTLGQVLQTTGTGVQWVATSSLGISGGSGVTSVDATVPTGFSIAGGPITTSGTLAITYAAGYEGLKTASSTEWATFYTTPSTRITAGNNLSWSGNTLNANISTSSINYLRLVSGGLETSTTTDFLRAAYFTATSSSATSTFAGRVALNVSTTTNSAYVKNLIATSSLSIFTDGSSVLSRGISLDYSAYSGSFATVTGMYLLATPGIGVNQVGVDNDAQVYYANQTSIGNRNIFYSSGSSNIFVGSDNQFQFAGSGTTTAFGIRNFASSSLATNGVLYGVYNDISTPVGSSETGYVYGTYSIGRTFTGSVKNFYGNYVTSHPGSTGGTQYGTYVDLSAGTATKYSGIFLGGTFGIGSTTPSATLTVKGTTSAPTIDLFDIASSSGTSFFRVLASGNVGISSSSPTAKLVVTGNSGSLSDVFNVASSSNASMFIVKSNGAVGFGSSSPSAQLTVLKRAAFGVDLDLADFRLSDSSQILNIDSSGRFKYGESQDNSMSGPYVSFKTGRANGYVTGDYFVIDPLSVSGGNVFSVKEASTTKFVVQGQTGNVGIGSTTPGTTLAIQGTTSAPTRPILDVASSSGASYLRVSASGNVGIGTTSPVATLDVYGSMLLEGLNRYLNFGSTTNSSGYGFRDNGGVIEYRNLSGNWSTFGTGSATSSPNGANGNVQFNNAGDFGSDNLFVFDSVNSRLGIGTTTPQERLHVDGNILIGKRTDSAGTWTKRSNTTPGTITTSGTSAISTTTSMVVYNGSLYVGTMKASGAEIYRYSGTGSTWTKVSSTTAGVIGGTGTTSITAVSSMTVYNGQLYIGTKKTGGAEVYRYDGNSTWTVISSTTAGAIGGTATTTAIDEISSMVVHNGQLIIGTAKTSGAELYRYDVGTNIRDRWSKISHPQNAGTIGTTAVDRVGAMVSNNGFLFIGISKANTASVYRYDGANTFVIVNVAGTFTAGSGVDFVTSLAVYNGSLIAGIDSGAGTARVVRWNGSYTAGTIWSGISSTTAGIIDLDVGSQTGIDQIGAMTVYKDDLYVSTIDSTGIAQVYKYSAGTDWTLISSTTAGVINTGSGATAGISGVHAMTVYNDDLWVGTASTSATEIYSYNIVEGESNKLRFQADGDQSEGIQNGNSNYGEIQFVGEESARNGASSNNTGKFWFSHGLNTAYGAYDLAEDYPTRDDVLAPGDLVSLDTRERGFVRRAQGKNDKDVIGIYSVNPAIRLSQKDAYIDGARAVPVALAGRVPVTVTLENGPIKIGDYLTSSNEPGKAAKATKPGRVIGRALGAYSGAEGEEPSVTVFIGAESISWNDLQGAAEDVAALEDGEVPSDQNIVVEFVDTVNERAEDLVFAILNMADNVSIVITNRLTAITASVQDLFVKTLSVLPDGSIRLPTGSNQIAGVGMLSAGATDVFIPNDQVDEDTIIYITPTSEVESPLYIGKKDPGKGFHVRTKTASVDKEITFDWFFVKTYRPKGKENQEVNTLIQGQSNPNASTTITTISTDTNTVTSGGETEDTTTDENDNENDNSDSESATESNSSGVSSSNSANSPTETGSDTTENNQVISTPEVSSSLNSGSTNAPVQTVEGEAGTINQSLAPQPSAPPSPPASEPSTESSSAPAPTAPAE